MIAHPRRSRFARRSRTGGYGVWRSLVAHLLWEQDVGSSNLSTPTKRDRFAVAREFAVRILWVASASGTTTRQACQSHGSAQATHRYPRDPGARSSTGQSIGLLSRRLKVRVLPGAPARPHCGRDRVRLWRTRRLGQPACATALAVAIGFAYGELGAWVHRRRRLDPGHVLRAAVVRMRLSKSGCRL